VIGELVAKGQNLPQIVAILAWRRALLHHCVAAGVEYHVVLSALGNVRTILGIGANHGQFAPVERGCLPFAEITFFELQRALQRCVAPCSQATHTRHGREPLSHRRRANLLVMDHRGVTPCRSCGLLQHSERCFLGQKRPVRRPLTLGLLPLI